MIQVNVTWPELARFNAALRLYQAASKHSPEYVVRKQAQKLGYAAALALGELAPTKERIQQQARLLLHSGRGIRVRPKVLAKVYAGAHVAQEISGPRRLMMGRTARDGSTVLRGTNKKRLNIRALAVKREIAVRVAGRGSLRAASKFAAISRIAAASANKAKSQSRWGAILGELGIEIPTAQNAQARFQWPPPAAAGTARSIAHGMTRPKSLAALAKALREVRQDMMPYLARKLGNDWAQAHGRLGTLAAQ